MAQPPDDGIRPLPRIRDNDWVIGILKEHGAAKYRFDEENSLSYFVKIQALENERGARRQLDQVERNSRPIDGRIEHRSWSPDDGGIRTLWGSDLKRAIEEAKSNVKINGRVAVRIVRRERMFFGPNSKVPLADQKNAYFNRYEVETPEFIERRQKFAKVYNESYQGARRSGVDTPEGIALYLIHDGARRLAEHRYANREDQQEFLARVRNLLDASPDRKALIAKTVERLNEKKALKSNTPPPREPDPPTR